MRQNIVYFSLYSLPCVHINISASEVRVSVLISAKYYHPSPLCVHSEPLPAHPTTDLIKSFSVCFCLFTSVGTQYVIRSYFCE